MAAVVSSSVVFTGERLILLGLVQSAEQFFIERGQSSFGWIIMCFVFKSERGEANGTSQKHSGPSPLSASVLTLHFPT